MKHNKEKVIDFVCFWVVPTTTKIGQNIANYVHMYVAVTIQCLIIFFFRLLKMI